jgi:hypothetical protein
MNGPSTPPPRVLNTVAVYSFLRARLGVSSSCWTIGAGTVGYTCRSRSSLSMTWTWRDEVPARGFSIAG